MLPTHAATQRVPFAWLGLALCFAALAAFVMPAGAAGRGDWWTFHHDAAHTGRSAFSGPTSPLQKWMYTTPSLSAYSYSSPAIADDGTIYVGACDNNLYAFNPNGTKKWLFPTGNKIIGSPAIGADGTVYIGSEDNYLYAINPSNGAQKWSYATGFWIDSSPAVGADGTIYIGSYDGSLYAITASGAKKWAFAAGGFAGAPAIGADGTVYAGGQDNNLYALNPNTGTKNWSYTMGNIVSSSPAVGTDGTIYVGSFDNKLYAINANGTLKWTYTTGNQIFSSPAIGADGTIYVGSFDDKLYAITSAGALKWTFTTGGMIHSSPAIGADGKIYVGADDQNLYCLDPATGNKLWNFASGGLIYSSPAIGGDGTLYFGTYSGNFYALAQATLSLTKSVTPVSAAPGGTVNYTITAANNYGSAISSVVLTDQLPTQISYVNGSVTGGGVYDTGSRTITWTLGSLSNGSNTSLGFQATVNTDTPTGTAVTNVAQGSCAQTTQAVISNSAICTVLAPALALAKSATPLAVTPGGIVTYKLVATNTGNAVATNTVLTDTLPAQLTYVTGSATGGGSYNAATGTLSWALGTLAIGASAPAVTFKATVNAATPSASSVVNQAKVTCDMLLTPTTSNNATVYVGTTRAGDWWTFHHDVKHTGRSTFTGPATAQKRWSYVTGLDVYSSPAIAADGTIYVGSFDYNLYAINPNGTQKWAFPTQGYLYSSPAIGADGTIYIGSNDKNLYAVDPTTGKQKWVFTTGNWIRSSPTVGPDGTVYIASFDDKLYAIDPTLGTAIWSFTMGSDAYAAPAIADDGTIYLTSEDHKLYALTSAGVQKWAYTAGNIIFSSPAIGSDGTVYFGAEDNKLYAVSSTGTVKWTYATTGMIYATPAIGSDGSIYIGSDDHKLYAITSAGKLKWSYATGNTIKSSAAIGGDGTIYVGSYDKYLYALTSTGSKKWSYLTGNCVESSPAIGADGAIYCGSDDHSLYAFGAPIAYQPDLSIGNAGDTSYLGGGVYNTTGSGQTKSQTTSTGVAAQYLARLQNAGGAADSFTLTCPAPGSGWTLKVVDQTSGQDITASVTGAGWLVASFNAGSALTYTVNLTPDTTVAGGASATVSLIAVSVGDNTKSDVVKATATVVASYQPDLIICNAGDATFAGTGIFNLDGTNQTKSQAVQNGATASYQFQLQNAGNATDTFALTCSAAATGWTMQCLDQTSGNDLSSTITNGINVSLAPGMTAKYTLNITPGNALLAGVANTVKITAVSAADKTKADVAQAIATVASGYQPDLAISNAGETGYTGVGIVNLDGTGQTKTQSVPNGATAQYLFQLKNAGNTTDTYSLTCPTTAAGWTMQFIDTATGNDITTAMQTGVPVNLAPGAVAKYTLNVTPGSTILAGGALTLKITVVSAIDTTKADVVQAITTVASGYQPDLAIGNAGDPSYTGVGLINLTGTGQTKNQSVQNGVAASYQFQLMNAGNAADTYTLSCPAAAGWTVQCSDQTTGNDISGSLAAGVSVSLAPGAIEKYTLNVTPGSTLVAGAAAILKITAVSTADTTKADVVQAITTVAAGYQPDLAISNTGDSSYTGGGIFNLTGTGQTKYQTVQNSVTAQYPFQVTNAGNTTDTLTLNCPAASTGWTVQFIDTATGNDVTTAMQTGMPVNLAPSAVAKYTVNVTPGSTLTAGAQNTLKITAVSAIDTTKADAVLAVTTVASSNQPDLAICNYGETTYTGFGIFNLTGSGQTKSQATSSGVVVHYLFELKNAGNTTDTYALSCPSTLAGWTVQFVDQATGKDVTATMQTGINVTLAPGAIAKYTIHVTPGSTLLAGALSTLKITAVSSLDTTKADVAQAITTVTAGYQPDLAICNYGETTYTGVGVFNLTGSGQTKNQSAQTSVVLTYLFQLKNAGNTGDTYTLSCPAAPTGWTVQFVDQTSGKDITASLPAGVKVTLAAGAIAKYTVHVTAGSTLLAGAVNTLTIKAVSAGNTTQADVVQAVTTVTPVYQPDLAVCNYGDASYTGVGIFNLTGSGQAKSQSAANGVVLTYLFQLKNAGNTADTYALSCPFAATGWTIQFIDQATGKDITTSIKTGINVPLAVGALTKYTIHVTPGSTLPAGAVNTLTMKAVSAINTTQADVVQTITTVTPVYQPDLAVCNYGDAGYTGGGIFNLTGTGQTKNQSTQNGVVLTYLFQLQNAGNTADTYALSCPFAATGWTIQFIDQATGKDITTSIKTGVNVMLAAGALTKYTIHVTAGSTLIGGAMNTLKITAISSTSTTKADVVQAITTVLLYGQPDQAICNYGETAYTGLGVINLDGTNQTKAQTTSSGTVVHYLFEVKNTGSTTDTFTLQCSLPGVSGWTVQVVDRGTGKDITATITGSKGIATAALVPGALALYTLNVTPSTTPASGTSYPLLITAVSKYDTTKKDAVKAVTTKQ